MHKKLIGLTSLLLTACGGGGSEPSTTVTVSSSNTTAAVVNKPYFVEVSNAMKYTSSYPGTIGILALPLDINGDNRKDLVMQFVETGNSSQKLSTVARNELKVYVLQPDNTFADQTSTYVQGSTDLGGGARKAKIVDVNNDGKLDVIFATNQENGRDQSNPEFINGKLAALVSVGNLYVVRQFSKPRWYHSVNYGIDNQGRVYVTGAGMTGGPVSSTFYIDKQGNVTEVENSVPWISAGTFELYNENDNAKESNMLIQTSTEGADVSKAIQMEGYVKKNNAWTRVPNWNPYGNPVGKFKDSDFLIYKIDNQYITAAAYSESCVMRLTPTSKNIVVLKMHYNVLREPFVDGMAIGNNADIPSSMYKAITIENDKIVEVPLNIKGEIKDNVNINFFDCQDVNNDGYTDIVSYPYSHNGLPHIYINQKDNSFKYIAQNMLPDTYSAEFGNSKSTVLEDFDNDGYQDLFYWVANGFTGNKEMTFRFFRGQKSITE